MLLKGVNSTWTEQSFEVLKVIHDTLLIVRNPIATSKIKSSTSLYMIGRPFDLENYAQQFSENRTLYKDNSVKSINTGYSFHYLHSYLLNRNFEQSLINSKWQEN